MVEKTAFKVLYCGIDGISVLVAKVNDPKNPNTEWCAYFAITHIHPILQKESEFDRCYKKGEKCRKDVAELYFPEFKKYRWRY